MGAAVTGEGAQQADPAGQIRVPTALQALRSDSGAPSYAEIAVRISRLRAARGTSTHAATVARSTVYDAFRPDRKRLDADLVADIVLALGGSEEDAAAWRRRCATDTPAHRTERAAPAPAPPPAVATPARRAVPGAAALVLGVAALTAMNVGGGQIVLWFDLPLYLDMIGTAVAAIVWGPWYGVAVAITTQLAGGAAHGNALGLPFTVVGAAGALLWGYGVRLWGLGRTMPRFFALTVVVAVVCTLLAAPTTVLVYGGFSAHVAADSLTARLMGAGVPLDAAVFGANLLNSLLDKLISGFAALTISVAIVRRYQERFPVLARVPLLTDLDRCARMWRPQVSRRILFE